MFENAVVAPEDLPQVDAVTWQALDAKFVRRRQTEAAIVVFFVTLGIIVVQLILGIALDGEDPAFQPGWLWLIPVLVGLPLIVWPVVSVPKIGYALRERDILHRSGVFWHTVTAVPYNRIQHVEKSSTPLDRRFGLAALQLFTAGGAGSDLTIEGLPARIAERMRIFILEKTGATVEQA